MHAPRLETEHLLLAPCTAADAARLHAHWTDSEVRRFLWDDESIELAQAEAVVVASERCFAEQGYGFFVLRERSSGAFVGCCGLRLIEGESDVEILYSLEPAFWGRGFASEAARAVLADGFERVGLARIAGRVDTPNRASVCVLERLGMDARGERPVAGRPTLHFMLERPAAAGGGPASG